MLYLIRLLVRGLRKIRKYIEYKFKKIKVARGSVVFNNTFIGKGTRINAKSHLGPCTIGRYCAFGGRLVIRSSDHYVNYANMQDFTQRKIIGSDVKVAGKSKGEVRIGHGVWVGDSVIILPGVTIGNGAIIGAGSVVTKPIPGYAIAVGNPAKVIKMRFDKGVIKVLEGIKWWYWSEKKMRNNKWFFELDLTMITSDELAGLIKSKVIES